MSVLAETPRGFFISHEDAINEAVRGLAIKADPDFFAVKTPFRMDLEAAAKANDKTPRGRRKRNVSGDPFLEEKKIVSSFLEELKDGFSFKSLPESEVIRENNRSAREAVIKFETRSSTFEIKRGRNESSEAIMEKDFVLPANCEYIQDNLSSSHQDFKKFSSFDVIVVDPPWTNKHIKRRKGYEMTQNEDLENTLVAILSRCENSLVAIWAPPSKRHREAARSWLRKSGFHVTVRLIWAKVTQSGEFVVDLDKSHKAPFEFVFVGERQKSDERDFVVCSVPSGFHSHKPPLNRVLNALFDNRCEKGRCLELYGRYLAAGWTTLGNQCLKFQHKSFFIPSDR